VPFFMKLHFGRKLFSSNYGQIPTQNSRYTFICPFSNAYPNTKSFFYQRGGQMYLATSLQFSWCRKVANQHKDLLPYIHTYVVPHSNCELFLSS
jgi:hypothetical protein